MATRFLNIALATAALGIVPTLLLATTTTTSPAWGNTPGALSLDPPEAPSHLRIRTTRVPDSEWPHGYYTLTFASWTDNSSNEDGFTVEEWQRQSGVWVLAWSVSTPANSTAVEVDGSSSDYRFRVKAFNASGDSAWSNWAH